MSGPLRPPWTDTGGLQSDIHSIKSDLRNKANSYEITELRQTINRLDSRLSDLERSAWEAGSTLDGLVSRVEALETNTGEEHVDP